MREYTLAAMRLGQTMPERDPATFLPATKPKTVAGDLQRAAVRAVEQALTPLQELGDAAVVCDAVSIKGHGKLAYSAVNVLTGEAPVVLGVIHEFMGDAAGYTAAGSQIAQVFAGLRWGFLGRQWITNQFR
jgi:hypothetical protein